VCENYRHLLPQPECAINSANRRPRSRLKGSRRVKIEKSGRSKETAFYCTLRPHESATRVPHMKDEQEKTSYTGGRVLFR
jgi:hypothetical protein